MLNFGELRPVLQALENESLSGASTCVERCQNFLDSPNYVTFLQIELAAIIDGGQLFVETTFFLEGDGLLAFFTYEKIMALSHFVNDPHMPNLRAVCRELSSTAANPQEQYDVFFEHGMSVVRPGFEYFKQVMNGEKRGELASLLKFFQVAQYLRPHQMSLLNPSLTDLDNWKEIKSINKGAISLDALKLELPAYKAAATGVPCDVDLMRFWVDCGHALPSFTSLFKLFCLCNPSSAAVERLFSLLNLHFGSETHNALHDYVLLQMMYLYNEGL
jgi:hypothetical protein